MQQGVDQRSAIAVVLGGARSGVHHHSRWLVDDSQVVILIDDVEGDVLSDGAQRREFRIAKNGDLFAAAESKRRLGDVAVDQGFLFCQQLLHTGAADVGDVGGEKLIEPLASRIGGNEDRYGEAV